MPMDGAGIEGDPRFTSPGTGKNSIYSVSRYKLRSGSVALHKGEVVADNEGREF